MIILGAFARPINETFPLAWTGICHQTSDQHTTPPRSKPWLRERPTNIRRTVHAAEMHNTKHSALQAHCILVHGSSPRYATSSGDADLPLSLTAPFLGTDVTWPKRDCWFFIPPGRSCQLRPRLVHFGVHQAEVEELVLANSGPLEDRLPHQLLPGWSSGMILA